MKNIKIIIFIIIFIFFVNNVFGYSTDTHAALTQEIIDFYNQYFERKIPDSLKDFLIDGSRREDNFPRYFNHFYDPVYDRGLNDVVWGKGISAKVWAQDETKQNQLVYKVVQSIASILSAVQKRKIEDIEFETNFTWQKAINYYLNGDIEKAMFALGHVLHLIEDMGVPAHTRNDGHPAILGDEDSYEIWADRFKRNNIKENIKNNLKNKAPIILNDLNSYFVSLSTYTNNNFYSNDTIGIQSGYDKPFIDPVNIRKDGIYYYAFNYLDNEEYRLAVYRGQPKKYIWAFNQEDVYLKDDGQDYILKDYWKFLSTKVIQHGAGVIDLFFKEVEKAKNDFNKEKNKNFLGQLLEAGKDFINSLFVKDKNQEEIDLKNYDNFNQNKNLNNNFNLNNSNENKVNFCVFQTNRQPVLSPLIINEVAWMGDFESSNNEWIELKNISSRNLNLKGFQIIDQKENIKFIFENDLILKPNEFIVLKRNRDYKGVLSNTNEGLRLFDPNCNLLDEVFANPNWPGGDNKTKKTMERNKDLVWLTSLEALGTPGKENSVYFIKLKDDKEDINKKIEIKNEEELDEEENDLDFENLKTKTTTLNNLNKKSDKEEINLKNELSDKNDFKTCSFKTNLKPSYKNLIINEIAWMGDFESSNNEWIELKNISGKDLNIKNYQLIDQKEQIKIIFPDFVVKKNAFILLKRTPANFLKEVKEDFVYSGALSNSNEGLRLFDPNCNLLDEVFANPNWPAGDNKTKKTMERKNDLTWQTSLDIGGTPKKENSEGEKMINFSGGSVNNNLNNINLNLNASANQIILKILINEIKINPVNERFIELYNPNNFDVDLTGWYLQRKTNTSNSFTSLVSKTYFENKVIPAKGFLLISRSNLENSDIILSTLTLSDNNVIQLKNKEGDIIDKVGWGDIDDFEGVSFSNFSNFSIQRKYQDNNFIDTDNNLNDFEVLNCASPKNIYINCNLNNQNKIFGSLASKILISEVQLEGLNKGDEFIELYNPLDYDIDLSNYSIQYKSNSSEIFSSTTVLKKNFLSGQKIKSKGFFLIARGLDNEGKDGYLGNVLPDLTYRTFSLSSNVPGGTIFLVNNQEIITGFDDENIVDYINYEKLIAKGFKNFERKTFLDGYCYKAQDDYEFLGNSCLENEENYFDLRLIPKPQNTLSLVEPREKPSPVGNFNIVFNSSTLNLEFSWLKNDNSDLVYEISLFDEAKNIYSIFKTTTLSNFNERIYEIGKEFNFALKVVDKDGLSSDPVYKNIYIPSFLEKVYFYKKNYKGNDIYFINLFYNQYPFIPYDIYQPKALVFYLNKATVTPISNFIYEEYNIYYANNKMIENSSLINYHPCYNSSNLFNFTFYNKLSSFVPLPPNSSYFCYYGPFSSFYKSEALNLNHIVVALANPPYELTSSDYLNIAFYNMDYYWSWYSEKNFSLIAIDRTKYYFQENDPIEFLNFDPFSNLTYEVLNVDYENNKANIKVSWQKNDVFLIDGQINYIFNLKTENDNNDLWTLVWDNFWQFEIDLNKKYIFTLKAGDNLGRQKEQILEIFINN